VADLTALVYLFKRLFLHASGLEAVVVLLQFCGTGGALSFAKQLDMVSQYIL